MLKDLSFTTFACAKIFRAAAMLLFSIIVRGHREEKTKIIFKDLQPYKIPCKTDLVCLPLHKFARRPCYYCCHRKLTFKQAGEISDGTKFILSITRRQVFVILKFVIEITDGRTDGQTERHETPR